MVAHVCTRFDTSAAVTPPSGWTLVGERRQSVEDTISILYYKVAASESGNYVFGFATSGKVIQIARYSGQDAGTPEDAAETGDGSGGAIPACPPITTVTDNAIVIWVCAVVDGATITGPSAMTERLAITTATTCATFSDGVLSPAGASGNGVNSLGLDWGSKGASTNAYAVQHWAIRPSSGSTYAKTVPLAAIAAMSLGNVFTGRNSLTLASAAAILESSIFTGVNNQSLATIASVTPSSTFNAVNSLTLATIAVLLGGSTLAGANTLSLDAVTTLGAASIAVMPTSVTLAAVAELLANSASMISDSVTLAAIATLTPSASYTLANGITLSAVAALTPTSTLAGIGAVTLAAVAAIPPTSTVVAVLSVTLATTGAIIPIFIYTTPTVAGLVSVSDIAVASVSLVDRVLAFVIVSDTPAS